MPGRDDYIQRSPQQRLHVPQITYPTPDTDDLLLVEDVPITKTGYTPLTYGSGRDQDTTLKLVWQAPLSIGNNELVHRRVWSTDRTTASQDAYNYDISYPSGDPDYPLVKRTYILPRSTYAAVAEGTADSAFSGCVLTRQRVGRIGDPQLDSRYILVERWFEKVPGKVTLSEDEDTEHRVIIYTHRQMIADADLPVTNALSSTLGASYTNGKLLEWNASAWTTGAGYVIDAKKLPIEDSTAYVERVVQYCAKPPTRYSFPSQGYTFPGIYQLIAGGSWINFDEGYKTKHPWAGVDYTFIAARTMLRPVQEKFSYFLEGSQPAFPDLWRVVSPASASRFLPIPANTIHPAFSITEFGADIVTAVVETYPASTPPSYSYADVLLISCEDVTWRGRIKMRREVRISETRSPYTFP